MKKENYILVGSLAALGLGAFVWYKASKKIEEKEKKEQIDNVLDEVEKSGKASITKAQAKSIAEKLYNAMKDTGTDEDTIIAEIRKLNGADLSMVNAAFNKRAYGTFGSPAFGKGTDKKLLEWFREELSGDTLREVEAKFTASGIRGIKDDIKVVNYVLSYHGAGEPLYEADYLFDRYPLRSLEDIKQYLEDDELNNDESFFDYVNYYPGESYDILKENYLSKKIGDEDETFAFFDDTVDKNILLEIYNDNLISNYIRDLELSGEIVNINGIYYYAF